MNLLKIDMLSMIEETSERLSPPYDSAAPISTALNDTISTIRQNVDRSHRIAILVHLYYLGELLSTISKPHSIWTKYLQEHPLPNHHKYYRAATRAFEIFHGNLEQIYRTKFLSMYYLAGMTNRDYNNDFLPYVKSLTLSSEDFAF